ncbi:MAG: ImmA/IrrE family metallo-endopeptidase [Chloroflexi bacterium]|nr:ImmA/IrrE family metallo-endopeptidase [Chloroflexota bacterium]
MKNTPIDPYAAHEIQEIIARVLREVSPEPPLNTDEVLNRLKLDLHYFSLTDPSLRQEMVHRVKVGAIELAQKAAESLFSVADKAQVWGLWLPWKKGSGETSRGRVLISNEAPKLKHRWIKAHEIGHSLIPHHKRFLFGDPETTLSPACLEELEREANYAAGQLNFMQGRFVEEASDHARTIKSIQALAKTFGNSYPSTLWRFVEEAHKDEPLVGLVTALPHDRTAEEPCRYCIESPAFRRRFGKVSEAELIDALRSFCRYDRRRGPLGTGEVRLEDANGQQHTFHFETWANKYDVLTIGVYAGPVRPSIVVPSGSLRVD